MARHGWFNRPHVPALLRSHLADNHGGCDDHCDFIGGTTLRVSLCAIAVCWLLDDWRRIERAEEPGRPAGNRARPNIVFILADDLAPTAVGFAGNKQLRTPHIDRIASEGAVLTKHSSPRRSAALRAPVWSQPLLVGIRHP